MDKFHFAIDRGGTFTDIYAESNGKITTLKLLSNDPSNNYTDAPSEGIRRILIKEHCKEFSEKTPLKDIQISNYVASIRMGTTIATNALLERKGTKFLALVTKGFKDVFYIGNQARPNIFQLNVPESPLMYEKIIEVDERVIINAKDMRTEVCRELDIENLQIILQNEYNNGFQNISIAFVHSFLDPTHELRVEKVAKAIGFKYISLSHRVMPMIKYYPRASSACADAYLTPLIRDYVHSFIETFDSSFKDNVELYFMQSDSALVPARTFNGFRGVLSGPAGGYVGLSEIARRIPEYHSFIGFDMGGTSTDVSKFTKGTGEELCLSFEAKVSGFTFHAPQIDIKTVAAGGGSCLTFANGMMFVGPGSAGSNPGPACYGRGGPLSLTDANLLLGRIIPEKFPSVFGSDGKQPLDLAAAKKLFTELLKIISSESSQYNSIEALAYGFVTVANETMAAPIRLLTTSKGFLPSTHGLVVFGGAGGQHAAEVAKQLGISKVYIDKNASILSAYGISLAKLATDIQWPVSRPFTSVEWQYIKIDILQKFKQLLKDFKKKYDKSAKENSIICVLLYFNLKFEGTGFPILTSIDSILPIHEFESFLMETNSTLFEKFQNRFRQLHENEYGFVLNNREIILDDILMKITCSFSKEMSETIKKHVPSNKTAVFYTKSYIESDKITGAGSMENIPVYEVSSTDSVSADGPALIYIKDTSVFVPKNCNANVDCDGNITLNIIDKSENTILSTDPASVSIFANRFMSVAEQMGTVLQRTALSTNIKERLDFSCAIFNAEGELIANAPHIPVHLGSMQEAICYQLKHQEMNAGDVVLSNHPTCGGTHLPDITVISPIFVGNNKIASFFVASRGHHADIGGIAPGSMPPNSTTLAEEGAAFTSFKIVQNGVFQEEQLISILKEFNARKIDDNICDIKAQIAANKRGEQLLKDLANEFSLDSISEMMKSICYTSEKAVQNLLKSIPSESLECEDWMDDGTLIKLQLKLNQEKGEAVFDFSQVGHPVLGNWNAPKSITYSAILYCLRCLMEDNGSDLPLNQGVMRPVTVVFPQRPSLISPGSGAAVVAGNVLTSQRLVDVILKAFGRVADSQGCMNNISFGNSCFGYYETIGGGAGAGPTYHGRSAVHTHMTNTRITDVEILESRYPVLLHSFAIRANSGGQGAMNGGHGILRDIEFTQNDIVFSVLSERRAFAPNGLKNGSPGKRGLNLLLKTSAPFHLNEDDLQNQSPINIGSKRTLTLSKGDRIIILTPGGGAYGCN